MSDRILALIDVHHHSDDGVVDEIDLIEAIRKLVPVLHESKDGRDENTEILISLGSKIGGEHSEKHATILVGSMQAIRLVENQIEAMKHMDKISHTGNLKELLETLQEKMREALDDDDDKEQIDKAEEDTENNKDN